ncbi:hypothetical protein, variant [Aphanomyces invadans]|uniref:Tyrosyl-DNA phosphodiesterase n=1 Tax=Aphanomyces invadans TaxID=157072 RepID=A0A024UR23_9STRA|nr:hypothetical protein, variant [Aphanomyces invadans]ETW08063.1 hypothetical protein, variant [Aphanomyces invadans]|eukprot:XP_008864156.1 hypothetical protein, variant [Aphanomyces invadans]
MADDDNENKPAKRLKVAATPLGFHLTSLRSGTAEQNRYAMPLSRLLEGEFTQAIMTNYKVDVPWLFGQHPRLRQVPIYLLHGMHHDTVQAACRQYKQATVAAPPLPIPYGTHHTKMMILFYPAYIRVAIFTANFVAGDWDSKTQGLWTQDFPLKSTTTSTAAPSTFEADLLDYMTALKCSAVTALCREQFLKYDFSTANVVLVASVPGVYRGIHDMHKYGHLRVKKVLQQHVAPHSHPLVCQYSSLGSLDEKWLHEFYTSFVPGSGTTGSATAQRGAKTAPTLPVPAKLHCIWPCVAAVQNSIEGWDAGRSLPCTVKNLKPFLHKYLRHWDPPTELHRKTAMPHIKSYATIDPATENLDFVLLTSANLSKAAWGALEKGGTQFKIRSYELGVLFLPTDPPTPTRHFLRLLQHATTDAELTTSSAMYFPMPFRWPPRSYNPKTDEPWTWDLERTDVDVFGQTYRLD